MTTARTQGRRGNSQEHRDNAAEFYKLLLRWQRLKQQPSKGSRRAAIGLPAAMRADNVASHVREFIMTALDDGTSLATLQALVEELESKRARRER